MTANEKPATVFVLLAGMDREGSQLLSVHATMESAERAKQFEMSGKWPCDEYRIVESKVEP